MSNDSHLRRAAWAPPYARSALPNAEGGGSSDNLIHRNYLGVAQFGSALEWGSRGRKFKSSHSDQYGQLTQLVECLRHMEEVRGSSPLLPTSPKMSDFSDIFVFYTQERDENRERKKQQSVSAVFSDDRSGARIERCY